MSVKKEPCGRRSVLVEVEVSGTPEEVWQAIATRSRFLRALRIYLTHFRGQRSTIMQFVVPVARIEAQTCHA
jgi:hypothetical protein